VKILVVGGAGYIGSHMVKCLVLSGHQVVVLDNRCSGRADLRKYAPSYDVDAGDRTAVRELLREQGCDAVMHFAAHIEVAESVAQPAKYYANNLCNTLNLLHAMHEANVRRFIFSSTAAIFGSPQYVPIDETHPAAPINPYGRSKWLVEQALPDFAKAYGLQYSCLRYFNAAGADPDGEFGECHEPETHLIPLVMKTASGRRSEIVVYGKNHPTRDGTCERDFIHVCDLADAHLAALDYLVAGGEARAFNLGSGAGQTVQEIIDIAHEVCARPINVRYADPRPGDPARLVADSTLAMRTLQWAPRLSDTHTLLRHAWQWELKCAAAPPALPATDR
jgi:UDP-glucose 4-epimerase